MDSDLNDQHDDVPLLLFRVQARLYVPLPVVELAVLLHGEAKRPAQFVTVRTGTRWRPPR